MCELLALSTSQPVRLTFSLHTLASRGGEASTAHDGWGVAFYQVEDVALFREAPAAARSFATSKPKGRARTWQFHTSPRHARGGAALKHATLRARTRRPHAGVRSQRRPARHREEWSAVDGSLPSGRANRLHCAPPGPSPDHVGVSIALGEQAALFIASVPLTDEAWRPLSEGELVAARNGEVIATRLRW